MIAAASVELEGGFSSKLTYELSDAGIPVRHDGSVGRFTDRCPYRGEISNSPASIDGVLNFIHKYYPTEVNDTCGMHLHVSFDNKLDYMRLMTKTFYSYFLKEIEAWAKAEGIPENDRFWSRFRGDVHYTGRVWAPELQLLGHDLPNGEGSRYAILNFCWGKHGTLECRLMPMFEDKERSKRAIKAIVDIYEKYLTTHKPREPNYKIDVVDDSPEVLTEEITSCV